MRRSCALICAILLVILFFQACAKPKNIRVNPTQSFSEVKPNNSRYLKKTALVLKPLTKTPFGHQAEELFLQKVSDTLREYGDRFVLLTRQENQLPAFLNTSDLFNDPRNVFAVAEKARAEGYQCLLQATLLSISSEAKKTGIWWFRKERYFITVVTAIDVYDTFSGAKICSHARAETTKVDVIAYEDYLAGRSYGIQGVDAMILDLAEAMGKKAGRAIADTCWMASVVAVQGNRVDLIVDSSAGMKIGDALIVFENRRVLAGPKGERYVVPGYKVADLHITAMENRRAQASFEGQADIQPGDVAIAVK